ncbi:hypothetical protein DB42_BC00110 [Neochlamydia sp. EPS4]|nr:hypothetical protein DB42_BC00110 [Neochlamydia sp. EPS4]
MIAKANSVAAEGLRNVVWHIREKCYIAALELFLAKENLLQGF